jgi:hypothetical protein
MNITVDLNQDFLSAMNDKANKVAFQQDSRPMEDKAAVLR